MDQEYQGILLRRDNSTIKHVTMWEYTVRFALKRSVWLVGPMGIGKSTLQCVWARFWCRSCGKTSFIEGKSIDPIGILSKDNTIENIGAMILCDFNFKTMMDTSLNELELLSLFGVDEPGAIKARFGDAISPSTCAEYSQRIAAKVTIRQ